MYSHNFHSIFGSSPLEAETATPSSVIQSKNSDQLPIRSMREGLCGAECMGSDLLRTWLCQCHLLRACTPGIPAPLLCPVNKAAELLLLQQPASRSGETGRSEVKENDR